jgi:hypothetical protein
VSEAFCNPFIAERTRKRHRSYGIGDLTRTANIVLNRYCTASRRLEDYDGLAALSLFMSLRASIRAKVTAARLVQCKDADRAPLMASVQR